MLFTLKDVLIELAFALPDIFVGLAFIVFVAVRTVFGNEYSKKILPLLSIILAGGSFIISVVPFSAVKELNTFLFVYNQNLSYIKAILLGVATIWLIVLGRTQICKSFDSSLYFLIFGVINSIMICLSSNNFLSLIVGLELLNYLVCFLLLIDRGKTELRQAALRFMLTSSAVTAALMFGASLYYSQFKSLLFSDINLNGSLTSVIGTIFILIGLLFKLGIAPFHSWMVDIYEKASNALVMFLDAIWKLFMVFIFIKVFVVIIKDEPSQYKLALTIFSVISMLIGGIMPIFQENIKKFVAYASVGHMGLILSIFATTYSHHTVMPYITTHCIASICFFSAVIILEKYKTLERFKDLSGLIYSSPAIGLGILLALFANIGIPPFANFMAKLDILKSLINSESYLLLSITILHSILSILYTSKACRYLFRRHQQTNNFLAIRSKSIVILQVVLVLLIFLYGSMSTWFAKILN